MPNRKHYFSSSLHASGDFCTLSTATAERSGDWRNDSSGNEGGAGNTDPEAPNSDPQNTGSPPRSGDKESAQDRRSRLFRAASAQPSSSKKKHSLSLGSDSQPKSALDACLSPTNVEPRKSLLDQVARTFATDEAILPDVVSLVGPPELHHVALSSRLAPLLAASFRPTFAPHNTAEVRAVLQALMNKIQKYCNSTAKPPTTIKVCDFPLNYTKFLLIQFITLSRLPKTCKIRFC